MSDCPHCSKITEKSIRDMFEKRKSVRIEHVSVVRRWANVGGNYWEAEFFCDACGQNTVVRIELIDEPDPADWWKK